MPEWLWSTPPAEIERGLHYLSFTRTYIVPVLFVLAILYLLWHHYTESKKPGYEFGFVTQLNRFVSDHDKDLREENLIPHALKLFHRVFESYHIVYCSVYTFSDGKLIIPPPYVYPKSNGTDYSMTLNVGEGVAGRVYSDAMPRYMPRLNYPFTTPRKFPPTMSFPHAVKFEPHLRGEDLELVDEDLDIFSFKEQAEGRHGYLSFVSVPLKCVETQKCYGVLNFDFRKNDPLDKAGITMASVLGLMLGERLRRFRNDPIEPPLKPTDAHDAVTEIASTRPGRQIIRLGASGETLPAPPDHVERTPKEFSSKNHLTWKKIKLAWPQFKSH